MEKSNHTFISSTAWTERVGFVAALETIKFIPKKNVPELIKKEVKKLLRDGT